MKNAKETTREVKGGGSNWSYTPHESIEHMMGRGLDDMEDLSDIRKAIINAGEAYILLDSMSCLISIAEENVDHDDPDALMHLLQLFLSSIKSCKFYIQSTEELLHNIGAASGE
jgi:hypothetical protein